MLNEKTLFTELENAIKKSEIPEEARNKFLEKLSRFKDQKVRILIAGPTGSGKSSTINALFGRNVSKVGTSVNPETLEIEVHELDNLVIYDTPGFGDGRDNDGEHAEIIVDKLNETDEDGNALIDLVLVVIDGSSRDFGTTYEMINKVIIPALGKENSDRMLVAINQADMAMKGRGWNAETCEPNEELLSFLKEKAAAVKQRIYEETGVVTEPVYYSAGYMDENGVQVHPYNIEELAHYIVDKTSLEKRVVMASNLRNGIWAEDDDEDDDYDLDEEDIVDAFEKGYAVGEKILGIPGGLVGGVVSGTVKLLRDIVGIIID